MLIADRLWGVKGLTDNIRTPMFTLATIYEHGKDSNSRLLDYIAFVDPHTKEQLPEYQAIFGKQPGQFYALLIYDCVEDMVDIAWKRFVTDSVKCRGDGEIGIDYETGEQRKCAGVYNSEHPEQHGCEFARPAMHEGKKCLPECMPALSMRLAVPQVSERSIMQIDINNDVSNISTLISQLRIIEDRSRSRDGKPHMANVAVKVYLRIFYDSKTTTTHAWEIVPLCEAEAAAFRDSIEHLIHIEI